MPVILFRHELLHTDEPSDERTEDIVDTACRCSTPRRAPDPTNRDHAAQTQIEEC
jgi:hypothetical protein